MNCGLWTVCWTYQDHPRSDEVDKTISLSLFTWKLCSPLWGCVLPLLVRGNNHNAIYKLLLITSCHWCLPKILGSLNINFFQGLLLLTVYVHVYVYMHTPVTGCMWRPEDNFQVPLCSMGSGDWTQAVMFVQQELLPAEPFWCPDPRFLTGVEVGEETHIFGTAISTLSLSLKWQ